MAAVNTVLISATIDGLTNNGCDRYSNAPQSHAVCPHSGETVRIQCNSSTNSYIISKGGKNFSANQSVVLTSFEVSEAGNYKCAGETNICGTPEDILQVFIAGNNLKFAFFSP